MDISKRNNMKKIIILSFLFIFYQIKSQSTLWGVTQFGGYQFGTIYSFPLGDSSLNFVRKFPGEIIGRNPYNTQLVEVNNKLYGLTQSGGIYDRGILFEFDPSTNTYLKKIDFNGITNGAYPMGSLMLANNGKLY